MPILSKPMNSLWWQLNGTPHALLCCIVRLNAHALEDGAEAFYVAASYMHVRQR